MCHNFLCQGPEMTTCQKEVKGGGRCGGCDEWGEGAGKGWKKSGEKSGRAEKGLMWTDRGRI